MNQMKDQNSVSEYETEKEKWSRAHSIFIESLMKPDDNLRSCAHNQKCYNELMEIRERVLEITKGMNNPK